MYGKKAMFVKKRHFKDDLPCMIFNGRELPKFPYTIGSVDPAEENLCIRVETRRSLKDTDILIYERSKLTENGSDMGSALMLCNKILMERLHLLQRLDVLVIESQLPINYQAIRVAQHILTFIMTMIPSCAIYEVHSRFKSKQLGAPPKLKDAALKKWLKDMALRVLGYKGDTRSIEVLNSVAKYDDLSDVICLIEAFLKFMKMANIADELSRSQLPLQSSIQFPGQSLQAPGQSLQAPGQSLQAPGQSLQLNTPYNMSAFHAVNNSLVGTPTPTKPRRFQEVEEEEEEGEDYDDSSDDDDALNCMYQHIDSLSLAKKC